MRAWACSTLCVKIVNPLTRRMTRGIVANALAIRNPTTWRALATAAIASSALALGAGCGGAAKTVVVTRTVDASSAAAARAAAAAQVAAATHGASKAGQVPSTP